MGKEEIIIDPIIEEVPKTSKNLQQYLIGLILLCVVFFALLFTIAYLNLSPLFQALGLLLGSFLIYDIHHSLKFYVKQGR